MVLEVKPCDVTSVVWVRLQVCGCSDLQVRLVLISKALKAFFCFFIFIFLLQLFSNALHKVLNILFSGNKLIRVHQLFEAAPQDSHPGVNTWKLCVQAGVPDVSTLCVTFLGSSIMHSELQMLWQQVCIRLAHSELQEGGFNVALFHMTGNSRCHFWTLPPARERRGRLCKQNRK